MGTMFGNMGTWDSGDSCETCLLDFLEAGAFATGAVHCRNSNKQLIAKVKNKVWFESIVAVYRVAVNWSLETCILSKILTLQEGVDDTGEDQQVVMSISSCAQIDSVLLKSSLHAAL